MTGNDTTNNDYTLANKPTIIVTGGFGYLAPHIALALTDRYHVVLLTRNKESHFSINKELEGKFSKVLLKNADLTDSKQLDEVIKSISEGNSKDSTSTIAAVIHLGGVNEIICGKDEEKAFLVNAEGTKNIMTAASKNNILQFIYFSTFHVYGKSSGTITEETIPEPRHPYGSSKLKGEEYCKEIHYKNPQIDLKIVRLANGIAPPLFAHVDRWSLLLLDLCKQAQEKKVLTLKSHGFQKRNFITIEDINHAVEVLLEKPLNSKEDPVFNLGSSKSLTILNMAQLIIEVYEELYGEKIPFIAPKKEDDKEEPDLDFDIHKLKKKGFNPKEDVVSVIKNTLKFCEQFKKEKQNEQ